MFCLQVVTLVQPSLQAPAAQFCVEASELVAVSWQAPAAQF